MEIRELAVKVATEASRAIPLPGVGPVVEVLLRELLQVQDQQIAMLAKIEADVQRLADGPWRTGRRYLREATLPGRSAQQKSEALSRALEYFRQAVDLQPGSTFKRAAVSLDLAMLCALTGDVELAALYATESETEARQAVEFSARAAWKEEYGAKTELLDGVRELILVRNRWLGERKGAWIFLRISASRLTSTERFVRPLLRSEPTFPMTCPRSSRSRQRSGLTG